MVSERQQILKTGATEAQPCSGPLVLHRPHHSTKKEYKAKEYFKVLPHGMIYPRTEVIDVEGDPSHWLWAQEDGTSTGGMKHTQGARHTFHCGNNSPLAALQARACEVL